jgi:mono/diheme cytochrome c family protein
VTVRESLVIASLGAALLLVACEPKARLGNAKTEGRWLYELHCAECHEHPQPELHKQPPNLHGLFLAKSLPSGAPATEEQVRQTIIEGRGTMPAFDRRLSEEEVRDLLQYLRKLK